MGVGQGGGERDLGVGVDGVAAVGAATLGAGFDDGGAAVADDDVVAAGDGDCRIQPRSRIPGSPAASRGRCAGLRPPLTRRENPLAFQKRQKYGFVFIASPLVKSLSFRIRTHWRSFR